MLRVPRSFDDGRRGTALPQLQRAAAKRVVTILPGGFDQDSSQMRISGLGDVATNLRCAAGMLGWDEASKRHQARRGREAPCIAEFRRDGERREIIDAAKASQGDDARAERFEQEQIA